MSKRLRPFPDSIVLGDHGGDFDWAETPEDTISGSDEQECRCAVYVLSHFVAVRREIVVYDKPRRKEGQ